MPSRDFHDMFPEIPDDALIASQSTIQSLELSPCRVFYKPKERRPSEAMFFGTTTHAMVEGHLKGHYSEWDLVDPNVVYDQAFILADEDGFRLTDVMPDRERRAKFAMDVAEATAEWLRQWWQADQNQNLQIRSVEEPFAMRLEGWENPEVWFVTGGIDVLLEDWTMIDWKTASVGWAKGKGSALSQKEAYAMLVANKYGHLPTKMRFVVYDRARKLWVERPADITPQSVAAYKARVQGWVTYLRNPFHLCTPTDGKQRGWWAKPDYNDVWNTCPSCRHLGDGYDSKEKKENSTW